ncbi:PilZ domain-containing protein [Mangrovibacillus cuniculi]|uniref:PilZ domain-containing protein n=1 Tax=Mangrovibacillus cuniculi TaxID=2593652 RepID=A0A7S8CA18_9BACI|nr:PilZ domain-containing protein [Mangrovibacillus cuniculi]QPC46155.1 PilZ domain-containing protein [Mangrovibacillus cuniculi]
MKYKRDESFRFSLIKPIEGTFSIKISNTQKETETKLGKLLIDNISPSGLKFSCPLNIPEDNPDVVLHIKFPLGDIQVETYGTIVWKKKDHSGYLYGFESTPNPEVENQIITELKKIVKKSHNK